MFYWCFLVGLFFFFNILYFFWDGMPVWLEGRGCSLLAGMELSEAGRQDMKWDAPTSGSPGGGCPPAGQEARAPSAPAKKNLSRTASPLC